MAGAGDVCDALYFVRGVKILGLSVTRPEALHEDLKVTRRTTTSREAAEAAFKAATTKPAELPPKRPSVPGVKEQVSLRIDRMFLIISKRAGRVGKTGSMRR